MVVIISVLQIFLLVGNWNCLALDVSEDLHVNCQVTTYIAMCFWWI